MNRRSHDTTIVITDIKAALSTSENEAVQKPPCLLVVGGDLNGTLFDLTKEKTTVGRNAECDIVLEFQGISRLHMTLYVGEDSVFVEDAGSRNGTFLNNQNIPESEHVLLHKGDIIKMGAMALRFLPKGDPERLTYDKLTLDAHTDGLTKCFNKSYFNQSLDLEIKKSKVTGNPLSLIIFDLDKFKNLNDNYGHDAGDFVLKEMAQVIRSNGVREGDVFARYGGEEFCILLPKTNIKNAFEIAERLRKTLENHHFIYDGKRLPVTASVGVADYRLGVLTGVDLFKRADQAVYKSKEGGRNQVNFYRD